MNSTITSMPSVRKEPARVQFNMAKMGADTHSHEEPEQLSRSPLAPVDYQQQERSSSSEQKGQQSSKPGSFFQNVFASRSEANGSSYSDGKSLPTVPSGSFEKATENAPTQNYASGMRPSSMKKKSEQVSSRGSKSQIDDKLMRDRAGLMTSHSLRSTESSVPSAPSLSQDSDDSDVPNVDEKTINDVSRFLDSLHSKKSKSIEDDDDPVVQLRAISSDEADHRLAQLRATGSDDTDQGEAALRGVNAETLAEIGAFIDSVAAPPRTITKGSGSDDSTEDIVSLLMAKKKMGETVASGSVARSDAPTFSDPTFTQKDHMPTSGRNIFDDEEIQLVSSSSSDSNIVDQTRTSKPSPIYEQLESLPQGSDPPSVCRYNGPRSKADPPTPNDLSDAVMRMHEAGVAPSYSAESLESGVNINMDDEEKKEDLVYLADLGKSLSPVMEAPSAENDENSEVASDSSSSFDEKDDDKQSTEKLDAPMEGVKESSPTGKEIASSSAEDFDYDDLLLRALGTTDAGSPRKGPSTLAPETQVDTTKGPDESIEQSYEELDSSSSSSESPESDDESDWQERKQAGEKTRHTESSGATDPPTSTGVSDDQIELCKSSDSDLAGAERYASLEERYASLEELSKSKGNSEEESVENDDSHEKDASGEMASTKNESGSLPNWPSITADEVVDPIPWELKDIASEETEKAAGRTRPRMTGPRARSRIIKSLLSDDTSVAQSYALDRIDSNETSVEGEASVDGKTGAKGEPSGKVNTKVNHVYSTNDVVVFDGDEGVEMLDSEGIELLGTTHQTNEDSVQDTALVEESRETHPTEVGPIPPLPSGRSEDVHGVLGKRPDPDGSLNGQESQEDEEVELIEPEGRLETTENEGGFLEQFNALEVNDDEDVQDGDAPGNKLQINAEDEPHVGDELLDSPTAIAKFFATLADGDDNKDENQTKKVRGFQKLVAPVIAGQKPSIIEAAQIQQAAIRANVPVGIVDNFANDQELRTTIPPTTPSDANAKEWEDTHVGDLDEDEAIGAFLSGDAEEVIEAGAKVHLVPEEEEEHWWQGVSPEEKKEVSTKPSNDDSAESDEWDNTSQDANDANSKGEADNVTSPVKEPKRTDEHGQRKQNLPTAVDTRMPKKTFGYDDQKDKGAWLRKRAMATSGKSLGDRSKWLSSPKHGTMDTPEEINGVAAAENLGRFSSGKIMFPTARPWKLLYKARTKHHSGYFDIDVFSIYNSTVVDFAPTDVDYTPWEHREVKQGFFHERSIAFSRNWFGALVKSRGNKKYKAPVCQPKSMEMPIENIPDPGEWTEEWYTTWKAPQDMVDQPQRSKSRSSNDSCSSDGSDSTDRGSFMDTDRGSADRGSFTDTERGSLTDQGSESSSIDDTVDGEPTFSGSVDTDDDDATYWEEAPECGTIINVKQKIGERVSRVHPDYTSSLRRSRWRKKHFPRGTFPY